MLVRARVCSLAEVALRAALFLAGGQLFVWSLARFAAIRQRCQFACDEPAGLFAAFQPAALTLILLALPGTSDTLLNRVAARAGTMWLLFVCVMLQTLPHYANVVRVYNHECPELYQSGLACAGSLARNGLGVAIGVACSAALTVSLGRACLEPASLRREVAWLWNTLRAFAGGIGVNILLTCPAIALGDASFASSPDFVSFVLLAGPAYLAVGVGATPEMRDKLDAWLVQVSR